MSVRVEPACCTSCGHEAGCPCDCCFPGLMPTPVAACPDCMGTCIDEGFNYWCRGCRHNWDPAEVGYFEGDNDD